MKKIINSICLFLITQRWLYFVIPPLVFVMCTDKTEKRETFIELTNNNFTEFSYNTTGLTLSENGIVKGSDNHQYLICNYGDNGESVSHYIDCKLCLEREYYKTHVPKTHNDSLTYDEVRAMLWCK